MNVWGNSGIKMSWNGSFTLTQIFLTFKALKIKKKKKFPPWNLHPHAMRQSLSLSFSFFLFLSFSPSLHPCLLFENVSCRKFSTFPVNILQFPLTPYSTALCFCSHDCNKHALTKVKSPFFVPGPDILYK